MAMNVLQSPSRPGLGKVSGFFWRNPGLGLFLLLLGPLMWFGIVYFGSLLTLLWQGFYTFDDFTMSVAPELTLANIRALFNPANYDIILRTLIMAVAVTIASAILAFPMAWYMARYTSGKMKAFFYIAVMLPMWASYIVKAYAWTLLLAKDGVSAVVFTASWAGATTHGVSHTTGGGRQYAVNVRTGTLSRVSLYLAAVHDPAGAGSAGAFAAVIVAGVG
ncbi:ABC transporter permease [Escherichia coli]|uniref:ABC transporter permease n=1 Tax=Escherichia coli TaxID=562 RepID=A0A376LPF6_ECOLX|nr:ABC transporter permease [Escherichia coli]